MPAARAASNMRSTSSCWKSFPHSPPNCQVPKPITETRRFVLPSLRYFMGGYYKKNTRRGAGGPHRNFGRRIVASGGGGLHRRRRFDPADAGGLHPLGAAFSLIVH